MGGKAERRSRPRTLQRPKSHVILIDPPQIASPIRRDGVSAHFESAKAHPNGHHIEAWLWCCRLTEDPCKRGIGAQRNVRELVFHIRYTCSPLAAMWPPHSLCKGRIYMTVNKLSAKKASRSRPSR